jgi:M6 family metalloprotease-like protein
MVKMVWSLKTVILVAGSWTVSLSGFGVVNGSIIPASPGFKNVTHHAKIQSGEPWEPVHMYRAKNNIKFNYRTKALNPEVCRYLEEDSCQVLDERFHSQAQKRKEHLQQQQQEQERHLQKGGPNTGSFKILVILLQFSDHAAAGKVLVPADEIRAALNGVGVDENLYPAGSFATYVGVSSYNTLSVTADVIDWQTTDNTEAYYADGRSGLPGGFIGVDQAVLPILNSMDAQGFDFSQYDSDYDGFIDVLMVLHSGYSAELGDQTACAPFAPYTNRIHSFATGAAPGLWTSSRLVELGVFLFASAYRGLCDANVARIGVITHEFGHTYGLPELYDDFGRHEDSVSSVGGLGGYDVM